MREVIPYLFILFCSCFVNSGYAQFNPTGETDKDKDKTASDNSYERVKQAKKKSFDFNALTSNTNIILESIIDPDKYFVGPGDRFLISIWGQVNESFTSFISPEGFIVIPSVKEIDVRNLSLSQAKQQIKQEMNKVYVKAEVSISLLSIRAFRVSVSGMTVAGTSVVVTPVDRVSDALLQAGGFADTLRSSLRNIEIRNINGNVRRADLVKRNNTGDLDSDPTLSNGDGIYVPPIQAWFYVFGAVNIPGRYEYVQGERLLDIVSLCAGLKYGADSSVVEVVRFVKDSVNETKTVTASIDDLHKFKEDADKNIFLKPDDRIFFKQKSKFHEKKNIVLRGEVMHPGVYAITEGKTTMTDIIAAAGGFASEVSFENIIIYRDPLLEGQDREFERLKLTPITDMNEIERAYFKAKTRQYYPNVQTDFLKLYNKNGTVNKIYDVQLKGNDLIEVGKTKKTVTVLGGVFSPGIIDLSPSANYEFYIEKTGGFTKKARRGDVRIIKGQNRRWVDADKKIKIDDGDIIFVPEKEPSSGWKTFRETLAVVGQLAAIVSTVFVIIFYIKQTKN